MIIGTAGHIDHGKTTLVRALTGVDTDRLPEEKKRGITIELGFAPLTLGSLGVVGMVDVPGHEGLVRTMLAGATGIDLGLVVVAADEGPMPQTREHLAILSLLGVKSVVVALTKCDAVDDEWRALAHEDVATLLRTTPFADSAIVHTAASTGLGLAELREALTLALQRAGDEAVRPPDDLFRMPIDRVFTVKGTGLVVTGTVWSGRADASTPLRIFPGNRPVRVRSIRSFSTAPSQAEPGHRTAFALSGAQGAELARGGWLVDDGAWTESSIIHADLNIEARRAPGPREWLRLHLGTADLGARVVVSARSDQAADIRTARVVLDTPLLSRAGDRFVLRRASPVETIGGGTVCDPAPARRRSRPRFDSKAPATDRLYELAAEAGTDGLSLQSLPVRLGVTPRQVDDVLAMCPAVKRIGSAVVSSSTLESASQRIVQLVDTFLTEKQIERGIQRTTVHSALGLQPEITDQLLAELVAAARLAVVDGLLTLPGWRPVVSDETAAAREVILAALSSSGIEPPAVQELRERLGRDPIPLLRLLEREGLVIPVETGRYYGKEAVESAIARMRSVMLPGREYSPAEFREIVGSTRKYLIPFLEYCDRRRITERRSAGRVLVGS